MLETVENEKGGVEEKPEISLQEGEISKPFKTDFGYHIIKLEKIRGQEFVIICYSIIGKK